MRIFILSNDDVTSNVIFSGLFDSPELEITGLALTTTLLNKGRGGMLRQALALLEGIDARYWLYQVFVNGWFKLREKLGGGGRCVDGRAIPSLRKLCAIHGIPVYRTADINAPEFVEVLTRARPDLVVLRINQLLKQQVLAVPRLGAWCVHSSLLPSYQGIAAEFHALRRREPVVGSTVFRVSLELDRGEPLRQTGLPVRAGNSVFSHILCNGFAARRMLRAAAEELSISGRIIPRLWGGSLDSCYFSWPRPGQTRELNAAGHSLITIGEALRHLVNRPLRLYCPSDAS